MTPRAGGSEFVRALRSAAHSESASETAAASGPKGAADREAEGRGRHQHQLVWGKVDEA